jgi:type IV pilus assembly protein PilV
MKIAAAGRIRFHQRGAYLLEALIGILVFALGVLGIVGLQAASLKTTTDTTLRAEAVLAASQLLGQMWADDVTQLAINYDSTLGGAKYNDFAAYLKQVQGSAWVQDPLVTIDACNLTVAGGPPSQTSHPVTIVIYWQTDAVAGIHNYETCGVIGQN